MRLSRLPPELLGSRKDVAKHGTGIGMSPQHMPLKEEHPVVV